MNTRVSLPKWTVFLLAVVIAIQGFLLSRAYLPQITRDTATETQSNKQVSEGYLNIDSQNIRADENIEFEYGYADRLNNEHLQTATTIVQVTTPDDVVYSAISGKVYPNDFKGGKTGRLTGTL